MRKTIIYNLFIFLLTFSIMLAIPMYLMLDQASKKMVSEIDRLVPVSIEQRAIFSSYEDNVRDNFISMSFYVFILAFLLSIFFGRRLIKPIRELYKGANAIKEGNLDVKIEASENDELREVAAAFNEMVVAIKKKTEELSWKDRYISMMMDPIWVVDSENVMTDINPAFTKLLGYEKGEVIGSSVFNFMDEENEKIMRRHLQARSEGVSTSYELSLISRRGELIPVLITGSPIYNEQGDIIAKIGIIKDFRKEITLRRALKESAEYQRAIMDSMPDVLVVIDRQKKVVMANKTAHDNLDRDPIGLHCYEALHGVPTECRSHGTEDCPVVEVFTGGRPYRTIHTHSLAGTEVIREIIAYPILDDSGEVKNVVSIVRDITDKTRFEAEIDLKNKELTALLDISRILNRSLRAEEILATILEKVISLSGMEGGGFFFLDDMGRDLSCRHHRGLSAEFVKSIGKIKLGDDLPGKVALTGNAFISTNLGADQRAEKSVFMHIGVRTLAIFPVAGKEKTLGVFFIFSIGSRTFSLEEERILYSAGEMAGMAFENIRLYERMRSLYQHQRWRRKEELKQLLDIVNVLSTKLDMKDVLETTLLMLKQTVRADFIWLLEKEQDGTLRVVSATEKRITVGTVAYAPGSKPIEASAMEKKEPVAVPEINDSGEFALSPLLAGSGYKSVSAIPLYSGDKAASALGFYSTDLRQVKEEDSFFLQTIASILEVAIERAGLYEKLSFGKRLADTILESIEDAIITVDRQGSIVSMNARAGKLAGGLSASGIGKPCTGLFDFSKENARFNIRMEEALGKSLEGSLTECEEIITSPEGERMPVILSSYPARDNDSVVQGVVFVLRDVTRRKEIERVKSEFLRAASHALRTPLSLIMGMSEMLLEKDVIGDKMDVYLETIVNESKKISGLVSDLMNLSDIERGSEMLRISDVDLEKLVTEVKEEFRPVLESKRDAININIRSELKGYRGDAEKLKQMLRNLIDNSLTYSNPECVVDISLSKKSGALELTVRDNGWGIPDEDLRHIGEKFYRGKFSSDTGGTGLGLSLSKEIVRLHDGVMNIESTHGSGTTVRISFPAKGPLLRKN